MCMKVFVRVSECIRDVYSVCGGGVGVSVTIYEKKKKRGARLRKSV